VLCAADGRSGGVLSGLGSHHVWNAAYTGTAWLLAAAAGLTLLSGVRYLTDARALFQARPLPAISVREERRPVAAGRDR
jgi:hypothetical protein